MNERIWSGQWSSAQAYVHGQIARHNAKLHRPADAPFIVGCLIDPADPDQIRSLAARVNHLHVVCEHGMTPPGSAVTVHQLPSSF